MDAPNRQAGLDQHPIARPTQLDAQLHLLRSQIHHAQNMANDTGETTELPGYWTNQMNQYSREYHGMLVAISERIARQRGMRVTEDPQGIQRERVPRSGMQPGAGSEEEARFGIDAAGEVGAEVEKGVGEEMKTRLGAGAHLGAEVQSQELDEEAAAEWAAEVAAAKVERVSALWAAKYGSQGVLADIGPAGGLVHHKDLTPRAPRQPIQVAGGVDVAQPARYAPLEWDPPWQPNIPVPAGTVALEGAAPVSEVLCDRTAAIHAIRENHLGKKRKAAEMVAAAE